MERMNEYSAGISTTRNNQAASHVDEGQSRASAITARRYPVSDEARAYGACEEASRIGAACEAITQWWNFLKRLWR